MRSTGRLTYSNIVSTLALFLALTGGVVYAAQRIGTKSLERHAVSAKKLAPDSVKEGKLVEGAVSTAKLRDQAVTPDKQAFPVFYVAEPSGGSAPVSSGQPQPYPLEGAVWEQGPGAVQVVFGEATGTIAYDGDGSGQCQVFFDIRLNGQQVGGGQLSTGSTTPEQVTASLGAQPTVDPESPTSVEMTIQTGSNGDCESGSTIDSSRFRILNFG
jgi:hypothetical protein